jgi:hypothetical protein
LCTIVVLFPLYKPPWPTLQFPSTHYTASSPQQVLHLLSALAGTLLLLCTQVICEKGLTY